GRKAFRRETSSDTMAAVMRDAPAELTNVSSGLAQVVGHCLGKDRDNRFQSARDVAFALSESSAAAPGLASVSVPRSRRRIVVSAAVAAIALIAALVLLRRSGSSSTGSIASIAVLPFTNLSGDKDQEYFSDGLAEELMGLLGKVKQLRVAGRMSSFAFKGKTEDLASIGQKLHVNAVLEGSVRRSGDQLRGST